MSWRVRTRKRRLGGASWIIVAAVVLALCRSWRNRFEPPGGQRRQAYVVEPRPDGVVRTLTVTATGYCNCGRCCSWRRDWFGLGRPVVDYGRTKGRPKEVGRTARGTMARHGTIAADPSVFRHGTRLHVPGYGLGKVEDVGGAIRGNHIDLWFSTHEEALSWGRRTVEIGLLD